MAEPRHDHDRRLCVFARSPELGRVKRRLAAELGDERALAAHVRLVEETLARCSGRPGWQTELWIADGDPDHPQVRAWCRRYGARYVSQVGADLGARMWHALASSLAAGTIPVLIGCDCPDIDAGYVAEAFAALAEADVVLGPARDGGYGLVGLRVAVPGLFEGVSWGSADVLDETLCRARCNGLSVRLLAPISDVDTALDWDRYTARD